MIEVDHDDPHAERGLAMVRAHPELKQLYGRTPWTAILALALVACHVGVALALSSMQAPWWAAVLTAWCLGALLTHALFTVIHEAAHHMVFAWRPGNRWLMLLSNIPLIVPFAVSLAHWHLVHHRTQGHRQRDPDLPAAWEVRIFKGTLGKWAWHLLFPLVQGARTLVPDARDAMPVDRWLLGNVVVQAVATTGLWWATGGIGMLYLAASLYFIFALHPLFGRYVQEHFVVFGQQETNSYYGVLNVLSLNFGHHVEHHDLPAVPWHRLPQVRRIAPEFYERPAHHSWTALWLRFLFDPTVQIDSRVVRDARG